VWILSAALAAAADSYVPVRTSAGCAISHRPDTHPDGPAMRAVCHWPEVPPAAFASAVQEYERYPELVFAIRVARVERREPDRALVFQRQQVAGLAPREVLVWMAAHSDPDGFTTVTWTTANEEPLTVTPGAVRMAKNEGYWRIGPHPRGGAWVEHEIAAEGGGSVPLWIVDLARSWAYIRILADSRSFAGSLDRAP
jgi:hypothetical protein